MIIVPSNEEGSSLLAHYPYRSSGGVCLLQLSRLWAYGMAQSFPHSKLVIKQILSCVKFCQNKCLTQLMGVNHGNLRRCKIVLLHHMKTPCISSFNLTSKTWGSVHVCRRAFNWLVVALLFSARQKRFVSPSPCSSITFCPLSAFYFP